MIGEARHSECTHEESPFDRGIASVLEIPRGYARDNDGLARMRVRLPRRATCAARQSGDGRPDLASRFSAQIKAPPAMQKPARFGGTF